MSQNAASYAEALSVCLGECGANADVTEPDFLEFLTTMPFGCTYLEFSPEEAGVFVPSGPGVDPHGGIDIALKASGWGAFEWHAAADQPHGEAEQEATSILSEGLQRFGPVLVGPLAGSGTDATFDLEGRFLAVTGVEQGDAVTVETGASQPKQRLAWDEFLAGWRADGVGYKRGAYTLRARFQQREAVPRSTVLARAVPVIRAKLAVDPAGSRSWGSDGPRVYAGVEAMRRFVRDLAVAYEGGTVDARWERGIIATLELAAARSERGAKFLDLAVKPQAAINLRRQSLVLSSAAMLVRGRDGAAAAQIATELIGDQASLLGDLR